MFEVRRLLQQLLLPTMARGGRSAAIAQVHAPGVRRLFSSTAVNGARSSTKKNSSENAIEAKIRAHNEQYARAANYAAQAKSKSRAAKKAATARTQKTLDAQGTKKSRAAIAEAREAAERRREMFAANRRRRNRLKPVAAGPVDLSVEPLVHSHRGEHVDLQPRPPITPAPSAIITPDDHPLYQFFRSKDTALTHPDLHDDIGRPWGVPELRRKRYEDLHTLWYVCLKELNLIKTEISALKGVLGRSTTTSAQAMLKDPKQAVVTTLRNIRIVLLERNAAYENAQKILKEKGGVQAIEAEVAAETEALPIEEEDDVFAEEEEKAVETEKKTL